MFTIFYRFFSREYSLVQNFKWKCCLEVLWGLLSCRLCSNLIRVIVSFSDCRQKCGRIAGSGWSWTKRARFTLTLRPTKNCLIGKFLSRAADSVFLAWTLAQISQNSKQILQICWLLLSGLARLTETAPYAVCPLLNPTAYSVVR